MDRARGPIEIPVLELWQISLITFFGALLLALIGWLVMRYLSKRTHTRPQKTPDFIALEQLKTAAQTTADDDKTFAMLSSHALRHYFETVKGMDEPGKTTDEFIRNLETNDLTDPATRTALANLLHQCDQIKFAGVQLAQEERQQLTENGSRPR